MDGRGRWMDNVFIERLWRSLTHEDIYLKGLCRQFAFYKPRPHQALGNRTPMAVWREGTTGALSDNAVDMIDNAGALPPCNIKTSPSPW
jgi:putative transposase